MQYLFSFRPHQCKGPERIEYYYSGNLNYRILYIDWCFLWFQDKMETPGSNLYAEGFRCQFVVACKDHLSDKTWQYEQ